MYALRFSSLGSGSQGNCTVIQSEHTTILVDCGLSTKKVKSQLGQRGIALASVDALFVTHRHTDHMGGIGRLQRAIGVPTYASAGTVFGQYRNGNRPDKDIEGDLVEIIADGTSVRVGEITIRAHTVPHDCIEPLQYTFEASGVSLGVLTDIGHIPARLAGIYGNCDGIFLESNHDYEMLMAGEYPESLKQRVASDLGHLNNQQTYSFLNQWSERMQQVVIGHVSEKNNSLELLENLYSKAPFRSRMTIANQSYGCDWVELHVS